MKKKILISTGGSGGHVVPATILYDHLKDEFETFMTCDARGIKYLDTSKFDIKVVKVSKISKNIFLIPFQIFLIVFTTIESIFFLKKKKIEVLISTGGYMSFPLCLAAKILNIRLFLYEPNLVLGRSNKLFIKYCEKIFCYSEKIKNFPINLKTKISLIQPLLRKEFYSIEIYKDIDKEINLLIIGGSQGAKLFDTAIKDSIIKLSRIYKLKVFHQTSLYNNEYLKNFYLKNNIENELFDFNDDISKFMSKSNICITRAGASTLAELNFLRIPHIVIPLPSAKDNHQFENARFYEKLGCNWILNQSEFYNNNLIDKLVNIIENKEEYLDKRNNMKNFNFQNTWNNINQKIITTINEN